MVTVSVDNNSTLYKFKGDYKNQKGSGGRETKTASAMLDFYQNS